LTLAFEVIGRTGSAQLVTEIAQRRGQSTAYRRTVVDIESEGNSGRRPALEYIHRSKTGALLRTSVRSGAIFSGATGAQLEAITDYGATLACCSRLSTTSSTLRINRVAGKDAGKDAAQLKATYPAVHA